MDVDDMSGLALSQADRLKRQEDKKEEKKRRIQ